MRQFGYARCAECGDTIGLTPAGYLLPHRDPQASSKHCFGSGHKPLTADLAGNGAAMVAPTPNERPVIV